MGGGGHVMQFNDNHTQISIHDFKCPDDSDDATVIHKSIAPAKRTYANSNRNRYPKPSALQYSDGTTNRSPPLSSIASSFFKSVKAEKYRKVKQKQKPTNQCHPM
jgi:hypothetical protein